MAFTGRGAYVGMMLAWLAIFFTFALGPLQWITLLDVGLSLKPMHPPLFLAAAIGWARFSQGRVSAELIRAILPFVLLYIGYLSLLFLSVLWGGTLTFTVKYLIYFICALGFMFLLATYDYDELMRVLFWGGISSSLFFVGVAALTLAANGVNLLDVVLRALITGNPAILQFVVFRNLFDAAAGDGGDAASVALRHTSLGFVYIGFMLAAATARSSLWSWAGLLFAGSIILITVSRSLTITVILALSPLVYGLSRKHPTTSLFALFGVFIAVLILPLYVDFSGFAKIIDERFSSLSEDGRFRMYDIAVGLINDRPLLGYGSGYYDDFGGHKEHQVHNLFLGAWIQAGVLSLFCAVGFTLFLATLYFKRLAYYISDPSKVCLLGILVLPLFRTQISGSGGNYNLPEWICIAIVMSLFAVTPQRVAGNAPASSASEDHGHSGPVTAS